MVRTRVNRPPKKAAASGKKATDFARIRT
jgi:hypothetical protein